MNKSDLVLEGPILISTTEVLGSEVMNHLRDKILEFIVNGYLKNAEVTKVLILTGSHGNEDGHSALSDISQHDEQLYKDDCLSVGLKPIKPKLLIIKDPSIPDITKIEKLNLDYFPNCFLCDKDISNITFQVTNISYYHKNEEQLIDDILRQWFLIIGYITFSRERLHKYNIII